MSRLLSKPPVPAPRRDREQFSPSKGLKKAALKRQRLHKSHEADQQGKLLDSDGYDGLFKPLYTKAYMDMLDQTAYNFEVFTEECYGVEKDSPLHGSNYFRPGGPIPTLETIRKFLAWYADGGEGRIAKNSWNPSETTSNQRMSVQTLEQVAERLVSALKYYNGSVRTDSQSQLMRFISTKLATDLNLVRDVKEKSSTLEADANILIRLIWDYSSSALCRSFRSQMNATIHLHNCLLLSVAA
ncbi:unnamed protein product [Calypogeia fissa]